MDIEGVKTALWNVLEGKPDGGELADVMSFCEQLVGRIAVLERHPRGSVERDITALVEWGKEAKTLTERIAALETELAEARRHLVPAEWNNLLAENTQLREALELARDALIDYVEDEFVCRECWRGHPSDPMQIRHGEGCRFPLIVRPLSAALAGGEES